MRYRAATARPTIRSSSAGVLARCEPVPLTMVIRSTGTCESSVSSQGSRRSDGRGRVMSGMTRATRSRAWTISRSGRAPLGSCTAARNAATSSVSPGTNRGSTTVRLGEEVRSSRPSVPYWSRRRLIGSHHSVPAGPRRAVTVGAAPGRALVSRGAVGAALLVVALARGASGAAPASPAASGPSPRSATSSPAPARQLRWEVVRGAPHDPGAFLQGLVWYDGGFFESTGLLGQSTLRRVEWPSGRVVRRVDLPADVFGEGLARVGDRLIQLTWRSGRGFVYRVATLQLIR